MLDDDVLVCRCEEVTVAQVKEAIAKGADSVTAVKRMTRAGMGLCQGRTCSKMIQQILAQQTGKSPDELLPDTNRPPFRPVTFGELCNEKES